MNERITDLHNQAIIFSHNNGGLRISSHIPNDYMKKFAELIVRECIDVLDGKIYESIDHEGNETWPDLILKEHFGVEE